jgi:hypothetical protein
VTIQLCSHLAPLAQALDAIQIPITYVGTPWSKNCRRWMYYACVLDLSSIRRNFALDTCVVDHVHLGTHDGAEAGLVCETCHDAVMGVHPLHRCDLPNFP